MALKVPGYSCNKMKPVAKRPLENKSFYLDLKMYPGEATLSKNLKFLGAKVEPLFSRTVSYVVTNRDSAKNAPNARTFKVPPKPQNWTPLTPITNTACHSPLFCNESSVDCIDSPPYTNSPATDQNVVPLCRGMAMVKKAILKKQIQGTTDLIENCRLWNVKVIHVNDILAKVDKLKSLYGAQFAAENKKTQNNERKLRPPFLKVEEPKKGRTLYREFPSSTFDNKLADKVKELYNHFKKSGNIQVALKSAQGEFSRNKCHTKPLIPQSPAPTQSVSKSFSKFSEAAKPSTAFSFCNVKRKISEPAAVAPKKQKTSQGKKKKFYCEICKMNYVHLDKHLASESHRIFMSDPMNFSEIENIILSLPTKEDFLSSRLQLASEIDQISGETSLFPSQVLNSTNNLGAYPNTCGLDLKGNVSAGIEDVDTEPYFDFDEYYVSPSCTSPDFVYLPYLEDSIDKVMSNSLEDTDIDNTPLNLSNDGNRSVVDQPINLKYPVNLTIRESVVENLREDIPAIENISNKRKLEEEHLIPLTKKPNSQYEAENQIHNDRSKDKTSQQIPFIIEHTQSQYFQCTDCSQANSFHSSQFEIVSSVIPDKIVRNPSIQVKSKRISNDSGISIQGSPTLTLRDSLEEETEDALLKVDECCALDLSITSGPNIEVQDLTIKSHCEETCAMSKLSTPHNLPQHDQPFEIPVEIHMPPLYPETHGNEPETNVVIDVNEKSKDLEMPNVVSEIKCDVSLQDQDASIIACQFVSYDYESIPNKYVCSSNEYTFDMKGVKHLETVKKNEHNVDLSTDIACDPIPNDFQDKAIYSSNGFEATTVAIGTTVEAPHILHASESDANLKDVSHVTNEPVSCENQDVLSQPHEATAVTVEEPEDDEESNILHNNERKADTQNPNHLTFSPEHKKIQQEAICSESVHKNIDIGVFENSSCQNTSNILHDCQKSDTPNVGSPTNALNPLLNIECQNTNDKVISYINDHNFVHLCEEVTRSFNDIESDLSSSEASYYELIEDSDIVSSGCSDCDWGPVQKNLDRLCKSVCGDNEDSDPSAMCC